MNDARLTIRLPQEKLDFVRGYAKRDGVTVTDLVLNYFSDLERKAAAASRRHYPPLSPATAAIVGIIPSDIDVEAEYHKHILEKYGCK